MICRSPTVRLVNHCFTTRTTCTNYTGRGLAYTLHGLSNDMPFTNSTTGKPLFHNPYESYKSYGWWTSQYTQYTLSLPNDIQFTNCTTVKPLFHDSFESDESYGWWTSQYTLSLSDDIQLTNCTAGKPFSLTTRTTCKSCAKTKMPVIRISSCTVNRTILIWAGQV